jgi:hypothetical protein
MGSSADIYLAKPSEAKGMVSYETIANWYRVSCFWECSEHSERGALLKLYAGRSRVGVSEITLIS